MAKASASAVQVGYIIESTWGTTPASAVQYFRATSASLKQVNNTVISDELRADGQVTDMVRVGVSATASIGYELSYGSIDDFLAAAFRSTWTADMGFSGAATGTDLLENGTTLKSFTLESYFSDITQYLALTGCRVNQLTMGLSAEGKVAGSIDFMGKVADIDSSTHGTGTATAAPSADIMSSINVSAATEGGSAVSLLGFDLTINNNLRNQPIVGTAATSLAGIGAGRIVVTGNARLYFEDATHLSKYLDFTASSIGITLTDAATNTYAFSLPRIRYTDGSTDATGNDTDIELPLPFQAVLDSTTGKTIRATRTAA